MRARTIATRVVHRKTHRAWVARREGRDARRDHRQAHHRLAELDVDLEERARHLAIAAIGADEEIAAALDAAATHARARGAAQAAAELAERAVALTPVDALESINRRRITAAERCRYAGDREKAALLLDE